MVKLGLVGTLTAHDQAVTERIWEILTAIEDLDCTYTFFPLTHTDEIASFFETFRTDPAFIGFGLTPQTSKLLQRYVHTYEQPIHHTPLSIIYKNTSGEIVGADTRPLAVQKAIEANHNLYRCTSILIASSHGTGLPFAYHFAETLGKTVYFYDPFLDALPKGAAKAGITQLHLLRDVISHTFDLIINTTDNSSLSTSEPSAFIAPFDLYILSKISHPQTIVQELTYLPQNTLFLQMAAHLELQTISGHSTLAFQMAENFKRYFHTAMREDAVMMLASELETYLLEHKK